jgi:hypothetical protein
VTMSPKTTKAPTPNKMIGHGLDCLRRSLTRGLSSRAIFESKPLKFGGESFGEVISGSGATAAGAITLAIGTNGLAMIGPGGLAAGGLTTVVAGTVGRAAAGPVETCLPEVAGFEGTTAGTEADSAKSKLLRSVAVGKRTTSWHLGHLILRPKTSAGTVNDAEQLGQATLTLNMRRLSWSDAKKDPSEPLLTLHCTRIRRNCPFRTSRKKMELRGRPGYRPYF